MIGTNRKVYIMVMLILNVWLIKVIESYSEKIKFCEFLRGQKGFHHCNDNFCSKVFVFDMENSSCSYIWLGSVQISKTVITVRHYSKNVVFLLYHKINTKFITYKMRSFFKYLFVLWRIAVFVEIVLMMIIMMLKIIRVLMIMLIILISSVEFIL